MASHPTTRVHAVVLTYAFTGTGHAHIARAVGRGGNEPPYTQQSPRLPAWLAGLLSALHCNARTAGPVLPFRARFAYPALCSGAALCVHRCVAVCLGYSHIKSMAAVLTPNTLLAPVHPPTHQPTALLHHRRISKGMAWACGKPFASFLPREGGVSCGEVRAISTHHTRTHAHTHIHR